MSDNRPWVRRRGRRLIRSSEHHQRRNSGYQAQMKKIQMKKIQMKKIQMKKIQMKKIQMKKVQMKKVQSRWSSHSTKGQ
jgi:hypothetical protein